MHFDNYISPELGNSTPLYMWHKLEAMIWPNRKWAARPLCGCIRCSDYIQSRWNVNQRRLTSPTLFLSQEDWGNRLSHQPELSAVFQSPGWTASTWLHSCLSVFRLDSDISLGYWTSYICSLGAGNYASLLQYGTRLFSSTGCIWLLAVMQIVSLKLHPSFVYFGLDPYMFITGTWTQSFLSYPSTLACLRAHGPYISSTQTGCNAPEEVGWFYYGIHWSVI